MHGQVEEKYSQALRSLLAEHGKVVRICEADRARYPHSPEMWVSAYGWEDEDVQAHVHVPTAEELAVHADAATYYGSCGLVVPAGIAVEEVAYYEWAGTGATGDERVGMNGFGTEQADITCGCGRYRGLTVRWEGTVTEALSHVLGEPQRFSLVL